MLSVPQTSNIIRDARTPINQHTVSDVTLYCNKWTQSYIEASGRFSRGQDPIPRR
jgi:hypothetical protein